MDGLVFEHDLLIQREVVMAISQNLLAPAGHRAWPMSAGWCRSPWPWASARRSSTSTSPTRRWWRPTPPPRPSARWARPIAEGTAALGSSLAGKLYGLEVLAADVEDNPENSTRFVVVAAVGHPRSHRPRRHQHRVLPARQPSRAACTPSWASSPPATSTWSSSSPVPPRARWATTASSSTSRAMSTTRWWPTASATCTPSWPASSSSGPTPRRATPAPRSGGTRRRRGGRPTSGSKACGAQIRRRSAACRPSGGMAERPNARLLNSLGRESRGFKSHSLRPARRP